jgi:hypothetical protein
MTAAIHSIAEAKWRDLAVAWIERRVFDAEQARRLAERAAIRAETEENSRWLRSTG